MNDTSAVYAKLARDGLWQNNPGLVQLLGLCPLLATSNNVVNGLSLGLATAFVLVMSNFAISAVRSIVRPEIRMPVFVMVIASLVTVVELLMNAYLQGLYEMLGIFLPIITTNCIIMGRAEAYAARNPVRLAAFDGLAMGLGFAAVLVVLGALRELVAHGTLFEGAHLLLGESFRGWKLVLVPEYHGLLLAALPPGAFIGLGLLIALKNQIDATLKRRATQPVPAPTPATA